MTNSEMAAPALGGVSLAHVRTMLGMFGPREWAIAAAGALATALLIAVPAALIENPVFGRAVESRTQDYVFLALTALLAGPLFASFSLTSAAGSEGTAATGGFLSFLAVGCPTCNKIVVVALGSSGALNFFGPAQFFIGLAAVALLGWALLLRARAVVGSCPA